MINTEKEEVWEGKAFCHICYEEESSRTNPLFQPCLCRGTVGYVHVDCSKAWRSYGLHPENRLLCANCKHPYRDPASPTLKFALASFQLVLLLGMCSTYVLPSNMMFFQTSVLWKRRALFALCLAICWRELCGGFVVAWTHTRWSFVLVNLLLVLEFLSEDAIPGWRLSCAFVEFVRIAVQVLVVGVAVGLLCETFRV